MFHQGVDQQPPSLARKVPAIKIAFRVVPVFAVMVWLIASQLSGHDIFLVKQLPAKQVIVAQGGYVPKVLLRKNGELLATFKTGAGHSGKTGRASLARSRDGGRTWSKPVTIFDMPNTDDSTDALGELPDGELVFAAVSYTYWKGDEHDIKYFHADTYVIRSKDDGVTWTPPAKVNTAPLTWSYPYGRMVILHDGTILLSGFGGYLPKDPDDNSYLRDPYQPNDTAYLPFGAENRSKPENLRGDFSFIVRSHDGGNTWSDLTVVARHFNETTILPLKDGRLLVVMRSQIGAHLATAFSSDQGRSWTAPQQITANGEHPGDLLRVADGRILLSYGERNRPYGVQAMLSSDEGLSWDYQNRLVLVWDGDHKDIGYPISVQRNDGAIVTLYYSVDGPPIFKGSELGVINAFAKAVIWHLPEK
jgi:photosystem II stability/assembly factor-like uncharacterized protein